MEDLSAFQRQPIYARGEMARLVSGAGYGDGDLGDSLSQNFALDHDVAAVWPVAEVFRIVNEAMRAAVEISVERVLREGVIVGLANHPFTR